MTASLVSTEPAPRRGVAISAVIIGVVAIMLTAAEALLGNAHDGQGWGPNLGIALLLMFAAPILGLVRVIVGLVGVVVSQSKWLSFVGCVLGLVPTVATFIAILTPIPLLGIPGIWGA